MVFKQTEDEWVVVGRFGRVHGIKGLISVVSYTDPADNILNFETLYIMIKKTWCPIRFTHTQWSGVKLLAQIENYLTREDASFLTNMEIAIPRQSLPSLNDNEYYLNDLVGLKVYNRQNQFLGTISEIFATGANDVLVISGKKRTLVPFIWDVYIHGIDLNEQSMLIDWDEEE